MAAVSWVMGGFLVQMFFVSDNCVLLHALIYSFMGKRILLFVVTLLFVSFLSDASGQKVYSCQYRSDADVKVYVSEYKSDADLVVYETKYRSDAGNNSGVWYFCEYKSDADTKIFFCDYKSDADIVIYFTKYKSDAGWRKNEKKHLMYKKN